MKKLTIKERNFCDIYVKTGNGAQSYRDAYNKPNLKPEQASTRAYELLQISYIAETIDKLREQLKEEHKVDRDRIISHHFKMIEAWEELWELGRKNDKTKDEVQRFYLLKEMVKGSDYRGSLAEISKLTGLYEPEKYEHKDTSHKTDWGS